MCGNQSNLGASLSTGKWSQAALLVPAPQFSLPVQLLCKGLAARPRFPVGKTIGQWVGTSDREFPFLTADKALPMLADHSQSGQQGIPFESNIWNPFQLTSCMAKHLGTVNNWKCRTERIKGQPRDLCVVQFNFDANFHLALSKGDGCDAEWARYTPQR